MVSGYAHLVQHVSINGSLAPEQMPPLLREACKELEAWLQRNPELQAHPLEHQHRELHRLLSVLRYLYQAEAILQVERLHDSNTPLTETDLADLRAIVIRLVVVLLNE
jgi:hypothetical protein